MKVRKSSGTKWITAGILFAIIWPSAATATKIGLTVAQPLVIAVVRFGIAAAIMLFFSHLIQKSRLPERHEWKQLCIYGLLNITIYLGTYIIAMQSVTAGVGAVAVATNPVLISFLSVFFLNKKLSFALIAGIIVSTVGVLVVAWPVFRDAQVTTTGLLILLFSMLSYSVGAIYFAKKDWRGLSLFTINGWQTLFGGLMLLPFTLLLYNHDANKYNSTFWYSVSWLAIPVSIFAVLLWLWLLNINPVQAGTWLFLCPVFGFGIAAWLMKDRISGFTIGGIVLVLAGLLLAQKDKFKN